jgi:hypothetical protein
MGSKTQKTETIRHRKQAPNKANRKTDRERISGNHKLLGKLEEENRK